MGDFQANFKRPDSGIHTVEGTVAGARAAELDRKRQRDQEAFEERKRQLTAASSPSLSMESKFAGGTDQEEQKFRTKTYGLVTAEEFKRLAEAAAAGEETVETETEEERVEREKAAKKAAKKARKAKKKMMATLSFAGEEEEVVEESKTSKKDPTVDTSFLPDRQREEQARTERERLEREWIEQQEQIKQEKLEITYSYWDGSGHRKTVVCRKGDTIGDFLEICRKGLCKEFRELSSVAADALMYVKEDLIIPSDMTFYDLIATKARGKSGPLFSFDVHEDVRLGPIDARVETDESHPGKVVERRWYDRNKHIFPASRWEVYDPTKDYGGYTIADRNKNKKR